MAHSSTFDRYTFAGILNDEVKTFAQKYYGGNSSLAIGKAFQFWCIQNISPAISEVDAETARSICEDEKSGDGGIDGAWIDESKKTLFLMQSKFSPVTINTDSEDFRLASFDSKAAKELDTGFSNIIPISKGSTTVGASKKLLYVSKLYTEAIKEQLRIELIITISGTPRKQLMDEVKKINDGFGDRTKFAKHYCHVYDIDELNQIYSDKWAKIPDPEDIVVEDSVELKNIDKTYYGIAATVQAYELVRIREKLGWGIYNSNFRFMLKKGVAKAKIERTLKDSVEKQNFWRYNNGITICCKDMKKVNAAGEHWTIDGLQVVNGLQTIETLYENKDKLSNEVKLLVRIIPINTSPDPAELEEHIAEYSNSQTPIGPRDLRANDAVQVQIERMAWEIYGFKYIRKGGDAPTKKGRRGYIEIDNEDAAQAALSFWFGKSWEAKQKKKLMFEHITSATPGFYDDIFIDGSTTTEYITFPKLLWDHAYKFIKKENDDFKKGIYKGTDLLALAILGEVFKEVMGITTAKPINSDEINEKLKTAVVNLYHVLEDDTQGRKAKQLWGPIFSVLSTIVKKKQKEKAKAEKKLTKEIQVRTIYVSFKYTDEALRALIKKSLHRRILRQAIENIFT